MGRNKLPGNRHLPPKMSARKLATKTLYYYCGKDGARVPLGPDLATAKLKWAQLETEGRILPDDSFAVLSQTWLDKGLGGRSAKTVKEYEQAIKRLRIAFKNAQRISDIRPSHVEEYLLKRTAKVAANREIAALSAMWNWLRGARHTDAPNPTLDIRRNKEEPRDVLVTDRQIAIVYAEADEPLRDAIDIARLSGQREADILKMRRDDIRDGYLWVQQGKGKTKLGIELAGEFGTVIEAIMKRPRTATGPYLVQTDAGQRLTYAMLRRRFDDAREAAGATWQFRDLRAKAATDLDDIRAAQELLGHKSEMTTAKVYRRRRGSKVKPVK